MFDSITPEMINGFTEKELEIYNYLVDNIKPDKLLSPLDIRRFSQLAFLLALRSNRNNEIVLAAKTLKKIFSDIVNSKYISIETKKRLKLAISDTLLDFNYASGDHKMASFRMMPFVINANSKGKGSK